MNELDNLYSTDYSQWLCNTEEVVRRAAADNAPKTGDPMADYKVQKEAELMAWF
jgi:hypothetical protein